MSDLHPDTPPLCVVGTLAFDDVETPSGARSGILRFHGIRVDGFNGDNRQVGRVHHSQPNRRRPGTRPLTIGGDGRQGVTS